jgi:ABC-type multidrug transport system fused ATPase/permease subunit
MKIIIGVESLETKAFEKSAKLAIEAITNIRTVAGLQCEAKYHEMYMILLTAPHKMTMNRSHMRGMIFGFAQAMQFFGWGIATFYGGILVDRNEIAFEDVFKVTNAIIGGAGMVGYSFAFTADFNKAAVAAARVFNLLERKPLIDTSENVGLRLGTGAGEADTAVTGNIRLKNGKFHYPTRRNVTVLNDMSLDIKVGFYL